MVISQRATCIRRKVGAVITGKGFILSSGYNGSFPGSAHCIDSPCEGATLPSGTGLDSCVSAHAEQNAIVRLTDLSAADTIYCTTSPCISCTKLILCTSIKRIVVDEDYPVSGKNLWISAGRIWDNYVE